MGGGIDGIVPAADGVLRHVRALDAACARFEELGVEFVKRPNDGAMKGIAFIKDPDGYWIEIFSGADLKRLITAVRG